MGKTTWIRSGLCLFAALALLCMGLALAESETAALSLSVDTTTVERGEVFEVTVAGNVAGAYGYNVRLLDSKDEKYDWAFEYDAGKFYISSAKAPAGDYRLVAYAVDANDDELCTSDEVTVQVTESSAEEKTIVFKVNHRENLSVNNYIYVSAYAPGADYVYIDWVGVDEYGPVDGTMDGMNLKLWDELGEQEFYAVATYPDGDVVRTENVTVNVGTLPSAGTVTITDMPTHLEAGNAFSASYTVERTEGVESELRVKAFTADNWELVYDEAIDGSGSFTIPAQQEGEDGNTYATFEAGRVYEIYVILTPADKANYGQGWDKRCFAAVPAASEEVRLSINDQTDGVEINRGEEAPVAISVQGATAVRFWVGDECVDLQDWGEWEDWSQTGEIQFNWSFWDKRAAYAEVCFDEDPWAEDAKWVRSNSVIVNVITSGRLDTPLVALSTSVTRGELLGVHVNALDNRSEWTYAILRDAEWNEILSVDVDSDNFYLPTAQLEPGKYILNVGSGAVGLDDGVATRWFEVSETEENISAEAVYWQFTDQHVMTHDDVFFGVYATDPEVASIHVDVVREESGDLYAWWDGGNVATGRFNTDREGTYVFTVSLHHKDEEEPFAAYFTQLYVEANGDLGPIQVKLPKTLALEQPLNGTIVSVEGVDWYSLNFEYNRDGEWEWFDGRDQEADNTTIDYDGRWFNEAGIYRLTVGAHAPGMNSSYADCYIVVNRETEESVSLIVGDQSEELFCDANMQVPLVVIADGGRDVQYFDGYEWRGIDHLENEIGYSGSESFGGGDTTVLARAWFDELGDWVYSNPVTVHADIKGEVGELILTLASDEVARGTALEVSFGPAEHANQYNMYIRGENRDFDVYIGGVEPGAYSLSTTMLEPGTYRVGVDYCGTGYDWRNVEQLFSVTEGVAPEDFNASLSATEVGCSKRVILSVYAPGAKGIRIYDREDANDDERISECDGDTLIQSLNWDHPDTLHFTASVFRDGEWSERKEIGTLRVIESPKLARPEILLTTTLISEGDEPWFQFKSVPEATLYWYELHDNDILNGNDQLMDGWYCDTQTVSLPASLFRAGHTYRLDVHAGAPGYETSDATYGFAVQPELVDGDITLYVNGETASVEGSASESFHVVADAPENAKAIIVSDGREWRWQRGNHFEDDFGYDFNGEVTLIARYTTDEIDYDDPRWETAGWAGYSNPVTVTIHSNGEMPEAEVDETALTSVMRGDWLEIQVSNAATFQDEKYENLWLHAEVCIPEGEGYGQYDWDGTSTIKLPTAELEVGKTYELHVRAGADGWVGSTSVYTFSVNTPEDDAIRGGIDKPVVATGETFTISVYAPGADQVKIFEDREERDRNENGNAIVSRHSRDEAGEYHFHAEVHYPDQPEWEVLDEIVVTVTAPNGDIRADEVNVQMSARLTEGQELNLSWVNPGNYHVDVEVRPLWDDREPVWHSWYDNGENGVTVPAVMPEHTSENVECWPDADGNVLKAGEFYRVNVHFSCPGFNSLHIEKQLVVVSNDMFTEGLELTVNGGTVDIETPVNTNVFVTVAAPESATAILAWDGYGWSFYESNRLETVWSWGDANERLLYARYTTDTIEDGKDWPEYGWSRVSNIVHVQTEAVGKLAAPEVTVADTAMRGSMLTITVNNPAAFQNIANLRLFAEASYPEGDGFGQFDWDGEGTIKLPTANLPEGEIFRLNVRASAPGYIESEWVSYFTVTEQTAQISFAVNKEEVDTCEDFAISVFAPGADEVRIYGNYREMDRWENTDHYVANQWYSEAGDCLIYARIHYPDGRWVQTQGISVKITATGTQLTAADVNLNVPSQLASGNDLTVSWAADADLYHYDVDVVRLSDGERVWHNWNLYGETEITVSAVMPNYTAENVECPLKTGEKVLAAGEAYEVIFSACRQGSNVLSVRKQVLVTAESTADESITLQLSKSNALVNEEVTVTVEAPADATGIFVWNGYDWEWHDGSDRSFGVAWGDAGERILYARYTTDPEAYRYSDWNEYEWSSLSNVVTVNVTKTGVVEAPVVILPSDTLLRGEKLSFTVTNVPDGFNWTVYDTVDGGEWNWNDWEEEFSHEIDTLHLHGNRTYLLCVNKYGSAGYEGLCVEIPFTVTADRVATVPEVDVAESIPQGDVLTITINNPEEGATYRAWFWQEGIGTNFASDWNGEDAIYLPSFNLNPGVYTELYVENDGGEGVEQSCTMISIEVTDPSGEMSLCLEKTKLLTMESTYIVAYAPGAESIRMDVYHAEEPNESFRGAYARGDVLQDWWDFSGRAGEKILTAVATYPDGTTEERTVHVTVSAPYGQLPEPVIELPDSVEAGVDMHFSVNAQNAEQWSAAVYDQTDNGRFLNQWYRDENSESSDFTVLASKLVEGHTYRIDVWAARCGWEEVNISREFTVVASDDPYAGDVLRLPAQLSEIETEAFEGISARTVVIPSGTTTIGSRAFANCGNLKYVDIPDSVTEIAENAFADSDVTFICNEDSDAYEFAQEHNILVLKKE